jgi:hypothetical protein
MMITHEENWNFSPAFSTEPFVANPHALLTDGVVTAVVFMQNYNEEEIKDTLSKYSYDEVIRWDDYGYAMYEGYVKIGDWVVRSQPSPKHTLNQTNGVWEVPFDPNYVCPPCDIHKEESN